MAFPLLATSGIFSILTNKYVLLGVAIIIGFTSSYFMGRYHGYSKEHAIRMEEQVSFQTLVKSTEARIAHLNSELGRVGVEAELRIQAVERELAGSKASLKRRINEIEELKRTTVPKSFVGLFNESTGSLRQPEGTAVDKETPSRIDEDTSRPQATTLTTVLEVATENNINHQAVVEQLKELQKFVCTLYEADGQPLVEYEVCVVPSQ